MISTVLPNQKTTEEQQREIAKYGREIKGVVDYLQLTDYVIKLT
jgi:hypothetical protein